MESLIDFIPEFHGNLAYDFVYNIYDGPDFYTIRRSVDDDGETFYCVVRHAPSNEFVIVAWQEVCEYDDIDWFPDDSTIHMYRVWPHEIMTTHFLPYPLEKR